MKTCKSSLKPQEALIADTYETTEFSLQIILLALQLPYRNRQPNRAILLLELAVPFLRNPKDPKQLSKDYLQLQ